MYAPDSPVLHGTGPPPAPGCPRTAGEARDLARQFLSVLSPRPTAEAADSVLLVVSELVANALRHAGGLTAVRLYAGRGTVDVVVRDPSPAPPHERGGDLGGTSGGFGWPMVRRLAGEVTVTRGPGGGKTVRATLSV